MSQGSAPAVRWMVSKRDGVNMIADDGMRSAVAALHHGYGQGSMEAAGMLEEMLRSMVDGDELHPAVEHVYAALCEAEARVAAAERRGV